MQFSTKIETLKYSLNSVSFRVKMTPLRNENVGLKHVPHSCYDVPVARVIIQDVLSLCT